VTEKEKARGKVIRQNAGNIKISRVIVLRKVFVMMGGENRGWTHGKPLNVKGKTGWPRQMDVGIFSRLGTDAKIKRLQPR
jgi:hypothetical protein